MRIVKELLYIVHEAEEILEGGREGGKVERFLKGMFPLFGGVDEML